MSQKKGNPNAFSFKRTSIPCLTAGDWEHPLYPVPTPNFRIQIHPSGCVCLFVPARWIDGESCLTQTGASAKEMQLPLYFTWMLGLMESEWIQDMCMARLTFYDPIQPPEPDEDGQLRPADPYATSASTRAHWVHQEQTFRGMLYIISMKPHMIDALKRGLERKEELEAIIEEPFDVDGLDLPEDPNEAFRAERRARTQHENARKKAEKELNELQFPDMLQRANLCLRTTRAAIAEDEKETAKLKDPTEFLDAVMIPRDYWHIFRPSHLQSFEKIRSMMPWLELDVSKHIESSPESLFTLDTAAYMVANHTRLGEDDDGFNLHEFLQKCHYTLCNKDYPSVGVHVFVTHTVPKYPGPLIYGCNIKSYSSPISEKELISIYEKLYKTSHDPAYRVLPAHKPYIINLAFAGIYKSGREDDLIDRQQVPMPRLRHLNPANPYYMSSLEIASSRGDFVMANRLTTPPCFPLVGTDNPNVQRAQSIIAQLERYRGQNKALKATLPLLRSSIGLAAVQRHSETYHEWMWMYARHNKTRGPVTDTFSIMPVAIGTCTMVSFHTLLDGTRGAGKTFNNTVANDMFPSFCAYNIKPTLVEWAAFGQKHGDGLVIQAEAGSPFISARVVNGHPDDADADKEAANNILDGVSMRRPRALRNGFDDDDQNNGYNSRISCVIGTNDGTAIRDSTRSRFMVKYFPLILARFTELISKNEKTSFSVQGMGADYQLLATAVCLSRVISVLVATRCFPPINDDLLRTTPVDNWSVIGRSVLAVGGFNFIDGEDRPVENLRSVIIASCLFTRCWDYLAHGKNPGLVNQLKQLSFDASCSAPLFEIAKDIASRSVVSLQDVMSGLSIYRDHAFNDTAYRLMIGYFRQFFALPLAAGAQASARTVYSIEHPYQEVVGSSGSGGSIDYKAVRKYTEQFQGMVVDQRQMEQWVATLEHTMDADTRRPMLSTSGTTVTISNKAFEYLSPLEVRMFASIVDQIVCVPVCDTQYYTTADIQRDVNDLIELTPEPNAIWPVIMTGARLVPAIQIVIAVGRVVVDLRDLYLHCDRSGTNTNISVNDFIRRNSRTGDARVIVKSSHRDEEIFELLCRKCVWVCRDQPGTQPSTDEDGEILLPPSTEVMFNSKIFDNLAPNSWWFNATAPCLLFRPARVPHIKVSAYCKLLFEKTSIACPIPIENIMAHQNRMYKTTSEQKVYMALNIFNGINAAAKRAEHRAHGRLQRAQNWELQLLNLLMTDIAETGRFKSLKIHVECVMHMLKLVVYPFGHVIDSIGHAYPRGKFITLSTECPWDVSQPLRILFWPDSIPGTDVHSFYSLHAPADHPRLYDYEEARRIHKSLFYRDDPAIDAAVLEAIEDAEDGQLMDVDV